MLSRGREAKIIACRADDSTKNFLEALGIIPGVTISIISKMKRNIIVSVKGTRLTLSKAIARQLIVQVLTEK